MAAVSLRVAVQREEQEVAVGLQEGPGEAEGRVEACRVQKHVGWWQVSNCIEIPKGADSDRSVSVGLHLPIIHLQAEVM